MPTSVGGHAWPFVSQAKPLTKTAVVLCSWFGTDNHTFTITSEYPALGVYPPPGSKPLPARTYTSFSAAAIDTSNSRYALPNMSWVLTLDHTSALASFGIHVNHDLEYSGQCESSGEVGRQTTMPPTTDPCS